MPLYESTFIIRQDMSTSDTEKLTDELSTILKDNGGKVVKKEYWGLRSMAYRIHKSRKGHYVWLGIDAPKEAISELNRKSRLNEDIVRNLTLKVENLPKDDTPILKEAANN